jgi:hypothetical protein
VLWLAGLAFLLASAITALELITAEYPHTSFVLTPRQCPAFYLYVLCYGAIAAFVFWKLDQANLNKIVRLEEIGWNTRLWVAIYVGVSIRALLNIRIVQARIGPLSFPVGLATFVVPLEAWLRGKKLRLQEWNAVRFYVNPRADKYDDISDVREHIRRNMPPHLAEEENKALELDVEQKLDSVVEIMERYLRTTGKRTFERVFPI